MERKEKRKEEVGTRGHPKGLELYGKQVVCRRRDDKTEVKSLVVLPETKKVAVLLASMLTMCNSVLFGEKPKGH